MAKVTRRHREMALDCFDWHREIHGPRRAAWVENDGATIDDAEELGDSTFGTELWFVAQALADLEQATAERCWDEGWVYRDRNGEDYGRTPANPYCKP